MARRFNGSSDYIIFTLPAVLQVLDAGPMTMAIAVKMNGLTDGAFIHTRTSGGTNSWWMECASSQWNYGQGVAARDVGDLSTSDGWTVLIGRKADGGASTPTGRKIILGGGTTDVTAPSALADGTVPGAGGIFQVGRWGTAAEYLDADIAACAVWNTALSDSDAATLTTYAAWLALNPLWVVAFAQASATDPIDDDSSGGTGDSSSITGTTIVSDPAGFFGGGPTNYTKSVAGGITPTSVLARQTAKTVAGAAAPTGALTRRTAKSMAGTVTPTGTLATLKAALRSFAGAITPTGALTRRTSKTLAGAIAPAGSVRRATAKLFAGTITAVGTVVKQTAKRFLGGLAPAGAVATSTGPPAPVRDLQVVVGAPEASWTAGLPDGAWAVGPPELHWTTGLPEV